MTVPGTGPGKVSFLMLSAVTFHFLAFHDAFVEAKLSNSDIDTLKKSKLDISF